MKIQATTASITHGHPLHKRGCYIELDLSMTNEQIKEAIVTLMNSLPEYDLYNFMQSEFPTLLEA